ncbi:hypothetical protein AVEN_65615-1 [Araneus ventricosus]|uniref:Uncharacterized protein n=1 Tax=Araneus ventricosus TaxID=182803 RepID=A0A4Y2VQ15_ARAVE|nr:hypothetical protein AVEN_65615-1 [Araneus ventricosus]
MRGEQCVASNVAKTLAGGVEKAGDACRWGVGREMSQSPEVVAFYRRLWGSRDRYEPITTSGKKIFFSLGTVPSYTFQYITIHLDHVTRNNQSEKVSIPHHTLGTT